MSGGGALPADGAWSKPSQPIPPLWPCQPPSNLGRWDGTLTTSLLIRTLEARTQHDCPELSSYPREAVSVVG